MTKRMTHEDRARVAQAKADEYADKAAEVRARTEVEIYRKVETLMRSCLWLSEQDETDAETKRQCEALAARLDVKLSRLRSSFRPVVNQNVPAAAPADEKGEAK